MVEGLLALRFGLRVAKTLCDLCHTVGPTGPPTGPPTEQHYYGPLGPLRRVAIQFNTRGPKN